MDFRVIAAACGVIYAINRVAVVCVVTGIRSFSHAPSILQTRYDGTR